MKTNPLALFVLAVPSVSLATVAHAESTALGALAEKVKSLQRTMDPLHQVTDRALQTSTCGGADCCTPCAKGLELASPDATIDLGDFAPEMVTKMTCSEGMALVETFPANEDSCPTLQMVGFAFCGCPEPPVMNTAGGICTLCSDGVPVVDPEVLVDLGNGESLSCGVAQLGLGFLNAGTDSTSGDAASEALSTMEQQVVVTESDDSSYDTGMNIDTCSLMQNSIGFLCGCAKTTSSSTAGACKICGSNGILTNPNHVVDDEEGLTCGAGAQQASIIPADDAFCAYVQAEATAAGCKCEDDSIEAKSNLPDASTSSTGADDSTNAAEDSMVVNQEESTPSDDITRKDVEEDGTVSSSSVVASFASPIFVATIAMALI
mmetsp:Transcript_20164/g.57843  ORF Transcript_20164/g.57843 Transcript_20164/m.57843 type:complete len:377 (+) Transcript_20164:325-1455(+)|eukprot:CAMPEP_0181028346 /NCGR_PEP_ID=MMETSP1070-20121207/4623_1 /TAXON_ID=265543 /ORGANISM="Minutocellus polymorphus, Strain NH13" /LENGTH=376 /DNA_ID=CAMNT_0023105597 /DNA_START=308 /DNA_END=1438 /DNA_ORIENTATION=-